MTQRELFTAALRDGDRVRLTDSRGKTHDTSIYGIADPKVYGICKLHVWSPWLSILFVTVDERQLERLP